MTLFSRRESVDDVHHADAEFAAFQGAWEDHFGEFDPTDPVERAQLVLAFHDWRARQRVSPTDPNEYIKMALRTVTHPEREAFVAAWQARFGPVESPRVALSVFPYFVAYDVELQGRNLRHCVGATRPAAVTPEEWLLAHYGP